jgi:hypothetical protein
LPLIGGEDPQQKRSYVVAHFNERIGLKNTECQN